MNKNLNISVFRIIREAIQFLKIESDIESNDIVFNEIKKGIVFRGTNLWILFFAIIVASVGLNMNSTAVIIGAMLISPLMGPINGMGYSIATYDFELFKKSVKNFTFAIITSLIGSTAYFLISPISAAHSELLARTSPTIYDVLIALFGGLAGIVAIVSKQKRNVIPGVAIATALMPPLCTAGYGLATLQMNFFFGAIYLFTINTIFIALAAVWVTQLLKFPIRTIVDEQKKKKINRIISLIITIVLLPSVYFGYQLVQKEKFSQKANLYISNISIFEGNYLLNYDIDVQEKRITLVYGGALLTDETKNQIIKKAKDFDIEKADIHIEQGLAFSNLDEKTLEIVKLKEEIFNLKTALNNKNAELDSILNQKKFGEVILNELKPIFPQITGCYYSESLSFYETNKNPIKTVVVILSINPEEELDNADKVKINNWLKNRLNYKNYKLRVYYE